MKRKRESKIHGQASKKLNVIPSSDVFRLKVASKLSALLNASLTELGKKSENLSASTDHLEVSRLPQLTVTAKPKASSEEKDLDPLTRSLLKFIDSAKTRLSELFKNKKENVLAKKNGVNREDLVKHRNEERTEICTSLDQDTLQAQISEKFQCLFKKALNTDILSQSVYEEKQTGTEVQIIDEDWQSVSVLLDNFLDSAREKINALLSTKTQTERNSKLISLSPIPDSLHKKKSYIPNSKFIKSGKYLSCEGAVDVIHVIDNSVEDIAIVENPCSSVPTQVVTQAVGKSLKYPQKIPVNLNSSVNHLLDKPLVTNESSGKCVASPDQFARNVTVKSLKAVNSQCLKTKHIYLADKTAVENSFTESNPVSSRILRSCSLHKSIAKPKSSKTSIARRKGIVQQQFARKVSNSFNSAKITVHQTKHKPSVSLNVGPSDKVTNKSASQRSSHNKLTTKFHKEGTDCSSEFLKIKLRASFKKLNHTAAMDFGMSYEPSSFGEPSNYGFESLDYGTGSGILLMDEAEHAPDVLNLEVVIDEGNNSEESSSEPEVLCLGEKVPTYEVVTIEEDDEAAQVSVADGIPATSTGSENPSEDKSFECPHCGKSYKVESLLKFHVRMHVSSVVQSHPTLEENKKMPTSQEGSSQEKKKTPKSRKSSLEKESNGSEVKHQKKKHLRRHKSRRLS